MTRVTQVKRTQTSAQICYGLAHRPILHKPCPCQISENTCPWQGSLDTSKRALKSQISENTCPQQGNLDTSKRALKSQISENTCPWQGSLDTSERALKSRVSENTCPPAGEPRHLKKCFEQSGFLFQAHGHGTNYITS